LPFKLTFFILIIRIRLFEEEGAEKSTHRREIGKVFTPPVRRCFVHQTSSGEIMNLTFRSNLKSKTTAAASLRPNRAFIPSEAYLKAELNNNTLS